MKLKLQNKIERIQSNIQFRQIKEPGSIEVKDHTVETYLQALNRRQCSCNRARGKVQDRW